MRFGPILPVIYLFSPSPHFSSLPFSSPITHTAPSYNALHCTLRSSRRSRSSILRKIHAGGSGGPGGGSKSSGSGGAKSAPTRRKYAQEKQLLEVEQNCFAQESSERITGKEKEKKKEKQRNHDLREDSGSYTDGIERHLFSTIHDTSIMRTPEEREVERGRGRDRGRRGNKDKDSCGGEGEGDESSDSHGGEGEGDEHARNRNECDPRSSINPPPQHWYFAQLATMFDGPRVRKI